MGNRPGVALIVGLGRYQRADITPLRYAGRDAEALRDLLAEPELSDLPPERVALLTDAEANRDEVVRRLSKWLPRHAAGAELAVIYFAGHGMTHRLGGKEEGYLLPYDADPDDLITTAVAMSDVTRWLEGVQAQAVVLCLDCCHAGHVLHAGGVSARAVERDLRVRPELLAAMTGKGRYLLASCGEGQTSLEVAELGHGLFTHHLLRGLEGAGDRDGDGRVGVAELFEYVADAVARDAEQKYQHAQKPWLSASGTGGVYLATVPPRTTRRPPPSVLEAKRLLREEGAAAVVALLERQWAEAPADEVAGYVRLLGEAADPVGVPVLFRCLAHGEEAVRKQARAAVQAVGWERAVQAIEGWGRAGDAARMEAVFEGLAAYAAHAEVLELLHRLVALCPGPLRQRAVLLHERKRLALDFDRTAELFGQLNVEFKLVKILGQGLFTAAYLARDEDAKLDVVVRVLRPEFAARPDVAAEFLELSRRSMHWVDRHLALTRKVGAPQKDGIYYALRDFVAGRTLDKFLDSGYRFPPAQALHILRQIVEALTPLHRRGLVHGGVKPSNIFVNEDEEVVLGDPSLPIKRVDFTLPRLTYDFRYAAPEQFHGTPVPASDWYSLGVVAYELFCGKPPYVADNSFLLISLHASAPLPPPSANGSPFGPAGDAFLKRLLAKAPGERFQSPKDVTGALQILREPEKGGPDVGRPPGPLARVPRPAVNPYQTVNSLVDFSASQSAGGEVPLSLDVPPPEEAPVNSGLDSRPPITGGFEDSIQAPTQNPPSGEYASASPDGGTLSLPPTINPGDDIPAEQGEYVSAPPSHLPDAPPWGVAQAVSGYEILDELGRGGMGVVYKARQAGLNRPVALKMILAGGHASAGELARFRTEAEAIAQLKHPHIVEIYNFGEHQGLPFFAMEFCAGGNLGSKIHGKPLPAKEAARIVETLAGAMQLVHEHGIIHRDLKPANILLTVDGQPKVTDFGLAKRLDGSAKTGAGAVLGTPSFMAPEQAMGRKDIGLAVDVYALGAILYELLTGRPPFKAASTMETLAQVIGEEPVPPTRFQPQTPRDLETICLKCLQKAPAQRYATAADLAKDLRRFQNGEPILARPVGLAERAVKWVRRNPTVAALTATILALLGLVLYFLFSFFS